MTNISSFTSSCRNKSDNPRLDLGSCVRSLGTDPRVYRMVSGPGEVLYVGKARNLRQGVWPTPGHTNLPLAMQRMIEQTRSVEFIITASESQALLLEADLIRQLKSKYNVLLRDDKSFACIHIDTSHDFPRLLKQRFRKIKSRNDTFGLFASSSALEITLDTLQHAFMLRSCSDVSASAPEDGHACNISCSTAPGVGKVNKEQYALQVEWVRNFFRKESCEVLPARAAASCKRAPRLRERWTLARSTAIPDCFQTHQGISLAKMEDTDIVAVHQQSWHYCMQVFSIRGGRQLRTRFSLR